MPGPCSLPNGNKAEWEEANQLICNVHPYCWPGIENKDSRTPHQWVTNREYDLIRNKLRTGKTSHVV